jgi:hypothetical protein
VSRAGHSAEPIAATISGAKEKRSRLKAMACVGAVSVLAPATGKRHYRLTWVDPETGGSTLGRERPEGRFELVGVEVRAQGYQQARTVHCGEVAGHGAGGPHAIQRRRHRRHRSQ